MKVFICGGGAGKQTIRAMKRLNEVIEHNLPCLYIPLAMEAENYDGCYRWITNELNCLDIPGIDMVRSAEELSGKCLDKYSFIFIGGGNTFKLLYDIKRVNMFGPIREYLLNGGVAFGGSAGAIIFGQDLESCALDDDNKVELLETDGYDVLEGISFLCHFTNRDEEHDRRSEQYLLEISKHRKVYALPEEDTLFLNEDHLEEIIDRPYFIFDNGKKIMVRVVEVRKAGRAVLK
ncbi:MAG: Type 1 glutamine amidotransferase-like domain-containing protein [Lachnospiraceae bacterium]|nr:Type 1 glutamine amidotransferase-like domain-containing protein [Lachnospiraceae bacterium]